MFLTDLTEEKSDLFTYEKIEVMEKEDFKKSQNSSDKTVVKNLKETEIDSDHSQKSSEEIKESSDLDKTQKQAVDSDNSNRSSEEKKESSDLDKTQKQTVDSDSSQKNSESLTNIRKMRRSKLNKKNISFSKPSSKSEKNKPAEENPLQQELIDLKKSYLYLQSEFANFKKTSEKQRLDLVSYSNFSFIEDLLTTVINDFNRALEQSYSEENFNDFKKGMEMIHQKFLKYLKEKGVEEINPVKGDVFDPHVHEVVNVQKDEELPENAILYTVKKGYKLEERLIQPAQVIVNQPSS